MILSRCSFKFCLPGLIILALVDICLASESIASQKPQDSFLRPIRPFSAVLVEYNKHNDQFKRKTKLTLSKYGLRTEGMNSGSSVEQMVFIQDYKTSRRWLANPIRACYSELPEGKPVEVPSDTTSGINLKPSILSAIPCNGSQSEKISSREVNNTELSVWKCSDDQGNTYIQHFSTLLGLVIRQESQNGEVGELENISLIDQSPTYFRPMEEWREVTLQEFITGRTLLPAYED
jgi:hypothetical protein